MNIFFFTYFMLMFFAIRHTKVIALFAQESTGVLK